MKTFAFIMALVVFAVSLAPCRDLSVVSKSGKVVTQIAVDDHHEHEDGSDDCPPFCSCSCCAAHGSPKGDITGPDGMIFDSYNYTSYYTGELISISIPVWQPPQLIA